MKQLLLSFAPSYSTSTLREGSIQPVKNVPQTILQHCSDELLTTLHLYTSSRIILVFHIFKPKRTYSNSIIFLIYKKVGKR